eukprot:g21001.t1
MPSVPEKAAIHFDLSKIDAYREQQTMIETASRNAQRQLVAELEAKGIAFELQQRGPSVIIAGAQNENKLEATAVEPFTPVRGRPATHVIVGAHLLVDYERSRLFHNLIRTTQRPPGYVAHNISRDPGLVDCTVDLCGHIGLHSPSPSPQCG